MNIAKILKYCPIGTKLYSPIVGEIKLNEVKGSYIEGVYTSIRGNNMSIVFTQEGKNPGSNGECMLFPSKEQHDWNKFRIPVKKGDIMMLIDEGFPFIANGIITKEGGLEYICGVSKEPNCLQISGLNNSCTLWTDEFCIPASEEAKKELFDKIAESGYKWNADTLKLEKIEPRFKEGDFIKNMQGTIYLVSKVYNNGTMHIEAALSTTSNLITNFSTTQSFDDMSLATEEEKNKLLSALVREGCKYDKEQHKLVKQEFKPFDKVLVRDCSNQKWAINMFSYYNKEDKDFPYVCISDCFSYCIPYKGNEYLVGTNKQPK